MQTFFWFYAMIFNRMVTACSAHSNPNNILNFYKRKGFNFNYVKKGFKE